MVDSAENKSGAPTISGGDRPSIRESQASIARNQDALANIAKQPGVLSQEVADHVQTVLGGTGTRTESSVKPAAPQKTGR